MIQRLPSRLPAFLLAMTVPSTAMAQSRDFISEDNKFLLATGIFLYLLPAWIAWSRKHHQKGPIILINIFLGWSVIGWFVALVWAVSSIKKEAVATASPQTASNEPSPVSDAPVAISAANKTIGERIADLKAMLDSGAISQSEFDLLKADAMKGLA